MKYFALIIEDHHTDVEVRLYTTPGLARAAAYRYLDTENHPDDYNVPSATEAEDNDRPFYKELDGSEGWWLLAGYGYGTGDYVSVREVEVVV